MGAGFHVVGLIILVVLGLLVVGTMFLCLKGFRFPGLGHINLDCPHCGAETRADLPMCQKCGKDL